LSPTICATPAPWRVRIYIHPHLLETFTAGTFSGYLASAQKPKGDLLEPDERSLLAFLRVLLAQEYGRP